MEYLVNAEQMKRCDEVTITEYGVPSLVLMERAAMAVVEELQSEVFDLTKVLVVCGAGNNGGDGFAIARLLHLQKIATAVLFAGKEESLTEETRIQKNICGKYGVKVLNISDSTEYINIDDICDEYTCIVDAVFGVGLSRPISGSYKDLVAAINHAKAAVLAVDIPSGISADDGHVMGCAVEAVKTVSFAFKKLGHVLYPGAEHCGAVVVRDIGIPVESFQARYPKCYSIDDEVIRDLPHRKPYSNKGTYGKGLLIAGSENMGGAAMLSAEAAYRTGTGLVAVLTDESNRTALYSVLPEAIVKTYQAGDFQTAVKESISGMTAIGIGPGLGTDDEKRAGLEYLIAESTVPLVLDADALNLLSWNKEMLKAHQGPIVITPHIIEMARLTGLDKADILADVVGVCREFAAAYGVVCVLKDARTVISNGDEICINQSGCNGMATGGSGDVLAGMITGLMAQGADAFAAAKMAVYFHGKAGEAAMAKLGARGMLAGDIVRNIPGILGEE